jgi:hypothetical protein
MNAVDTTLATVPEAVSGHMPLLSVDGLTLEFSTRSGVVHALEDVSFALYKGETVGLPRPAAPRRWKRAGSSSVRGHPRPRVPG